MLASRLGAFRRMAAETTKRGKTHIIYFHGINLNLYACLAILSTSAPAVATATSAASVDVSLHGDVLNVSPPDSPHTHKYPAVWLRDNCQCPMCFHQESRGRRILMRELDEHIVPKSADYVDADDKVKCQLCIIW